MWTFVWCLTVLFNGHDGKEPTDRLIPPNWSGNPWGPEASRARENGLLPIKMTPQMVAWEQWGKKYLRDGDIVFRRADARILFGRFPFSRFTAKITGSEFSHTGIVAIENGKTMVYDTTKAGVRKQPYAVWMLDNVGSFGARRLRPEFQKHAEGAIRYCREVFEKQVPFDYELGLDDSKLYCVEMTEKAYRASGLLLSEPVRLADMQYVDEFPIAVFMFNLLSPLKLDQSVFFPGNDNHGIWSAPSFVTLCPPTQPPLWGTSSTTANGAKANKDATTASRRAPKPN
ncbi:YiiX/YebB-like N1pC/P60 family cysteine hydrolase [Singulisphaera sp. PoT]|uniref:YiiX/YebB-like N1pC/P60 family cysteine hydrolase n=1 Tax=Singulisphaera sp. PoT TaxID=3411797 RepID=UPI003BF4C7CA